MAKKRSKSSLGWLWWLLALVLVDATALIVFSYLPSDSLPARARPLHDRVVDARSRLDGTAAEDALPPPPAMQQTVPGQAETAPPEAQAAQPKVDVYFSPRGGCTEAIVSEIEGARESVLVQAYSFTSAAIAKAIVAAHGRGVNVQVLLDKSQRTEKYTNADYLARAGIPVRIDARHAIAHNKVMVIDGDTVITGSFNFTKAAEDRNAENLLVIRDRGIAAKYTTNWREHDEHSEAYTGKVRESGDEQ